MRTKTNSFAAFFEPAWLWLAFAAVVGIAFWCAPRGFDFQDTGCYYLEYKFPKDVADTHTTYHLVARPFYVLVGESVVGFRIVSWIFVWISAAFFGWAWRRHLAALYERTPGLLSMSVAIAAMLLASSANYTIKPAALTYNSLNFVALCFALGLFLDGSARLMNAVVAQSYRLGIIEIAAGALAATVDLLIKPPTAVFLIAVIVGYCLVTPAIARSVKKKLGLVAVIAGAAGTLAMIIFVGGVGAFWERIHTLISIADNHAYMNELLTRVVREFGELGQFLWHDLKFALVLVAAAPLVLFALRQRETAQRRVAEIIGYLVFALWLYSTIDARLWRGSHQLYFEGIVARLYLGAAVLSAAALIASVLAAPITYRSEPRKSFFWPKLLLWLILILTPFAGAFGTTTSIYLNGALYAVCWMGALLLTMIELSVVWRARWALPFATVPFAVYAVAQLFHGQIIMPYMMNRPLWEQTVPTAVGNAHSILRMDPADSDFINTTRKILTDHGFTEGDDIFCFFNIPGLVYAVGGRSPVIPWYFGRIYVEDRVEEFYMQAAGPERRRKGWIITQADVLRFREHFHRGGINFPEDYEEIGALKNPESGLPVRIYKPRAGNP